MSKLDNPRINYTSINPSVIELILRNCRKVNNQFIVTYTKSLFSREIARHLPTEDISSDDYENDTLSESLQLYDEQTQELSPLELITEESMFEKAPSSVYIAPQFTEDQILLIAETIRYAALNHGYKERNDKTYYLSHVLETALIEMESAIKTAEILIKEGTYSKEYEQSVDYINIISDILHDIDEEEGVSVAKIIKHLRDYARENLSKEAALKFIKSDSKKLLRNLEVLDRRPQPGKSMEFIKETESNLPRRKPILNAKGEIIYVDHIERVKKRFDGLITKLGDIYNNNGTLQIADEKFIVSKGREMRRWFQKRFPRDSKQYRVARKIVHTVGRRIPHFLPVLRFDHYIDWDKAFENPKVIKTSLKGYVGVKAAEWYIRNNPEKDQHLLPYVETKRRAIANLVGNNLLKIALHCQYYHSETAEQSLLSSEEFFIDPVKRKCKWLKEFNDEDIAYAEHVIEEFKNSMKNSKANWILHFVKNIEKDKDLTKKNKTIIEYLVMKENEQKIGLLDMLLNIYEHPILNSKFGYPHTYKDNENLRKGTIRMLKGRKSTQFLLALAFGTVLKKSAHDPELYALAYEAT